ncbi:RNA-directed DNA polymerase, eukaryota, reverse transcriptase zinc-binding domain protein [Tanacetum coccineum]
MNKDGIVVEEKEVEVGNAEIEKNVHKESVNLSLEKNKGVFRCSDMEFDECNVIFGSMSKEDVEKDMEIDEQNKSIENEDVNVRNGSAVKSSDTNESTNGSNKLNNTAFVKIYAKTTEKPVLNKNLFSIPTSKKDNGDEVVVFEVEMMEEGKCGGISAVASRLGKPLVMDDMTASVCHNGTGRSAFARVLVEIDAANGFKDTIEIQYKDKNNNVIRTKFVKVEFSWKPVSCSHCKVFGHNGARCHKNRVKKYQLDNNKGVKVNSDNEGFVKVRNKRYGVQGIGGKNGKKHDKDNLMANENVKIQFKYVPKNGGYKDKERPESSKQGKIRKSANKYSVLADVEDNEPVNEECVDRRLKVDRFILKKSHPSKEDTADWTYDMKEYFKHKWNEVCRKENANDSESENDLVEENVATDYLVADEIDRVDTGRNVKFFCSFIYASNLGRERQDLWTMLQVHKNIANKRPWILMGDFKVTLKTSEHSAWGSCMSSDMIDFNECVNGIELEDICSSGFQFTWTKSLKNPNSMISILEGLKKKRRSFRFVNYIADKEEFAECVRKEWDADINGCHMYKVVQKLKRLKKPLNKLNWRNGNLTYKDKAASILNEYVVASSDELKLLHQKAKIKWLSEGDQNTAYFHGILKSRKHKGRTESICDENGNRYEGDDVANVFVEHFKKFWGTKHDVKPLESVEVVFDKVLSQEEAEGMIGNVTNDEIKEAFFKIDSSKACGPDGYTLGFFKKAWNIVGNEVCLAIKDFFLNGKLLGEIDATIIALVLKVDVPNKVSEFRPTACCNVIYKSISKILRNRIKVGLQKVVNINQSDFIPGRHIQDNILIAQELLKGYQRKKGAKRSALKIDIQKAYDTVSWAFLENIMLKFGFHPVMVNWIMTCVKTSKFSICVNGETHGYFEGGKGLRQGDPISPYLFTLVMDVFSLLLSSNIQKAKKFKFHYGCKESKLSNMCFADDLLVLCNRDVDSVDVIKQSMEQFSSISGLFPNIGKSTIFFGSVPLNVQNEILRDVPFQVGNLPIKYFGVPLIAKKLGVNDCKRLVNKVAEKINCWKNKWKVKVAWKQVCMPKEEGGLGIKSLKKWNEVLLIKQLWKIIDKKESLWVKWVNVGKLKDHVLFSTGNGESVSIWFDKWDLKGPLCDIIPIRYWYKERYTDNETVADMIYNVFRYGLLNGIETILNSVI